MEKKSFILTDYIFKNTTGVLFKIIFSDISSKKFALGVWFGLSFSIAIILGTIGLMDGFEHVLKERLRYTLGDVYFYSKDGFFNFSKELSLNINDFNIKKISPYIQTEAFAIKGESSKGVNVIGVQNISFNEAKDSIIEIKPGEAAIGIELAKVFDLKIGQDFVLALAKGNRSINSLPLFKHYRVGSIVQHKIYQKDLRLIYVNLKELAGFLDVKEKVNIVGLKLPNEKEAIGASAIENFTSKLKSRLGPNYIVRPYWHEYQTLLEAVEIEKLTIGLVLQVVVIISIFNVLAFIIFLNEKRGRELFLLKALGLSQRAIMKIWFKMAILLWLVSCILSVGMVMVFDWALENWSLFLLPKEIYYLERFSLVISWKSYFLVFFLALAWLIFFIVINFWKFREKTFLYELKRKFA